MDKSFRELLQRYKNHTASPQEQEKVEQALEAFEAINDYLSEQLEQLEEEPSLALSSQQDPLSDTALLRMVKRSIRTAFLKLGAGVLAVTLAVVLFLQFGLSPLMDHLFYNPAAPVGEFSDQMSLDMAVYTNLRLPLGKRDTVNSTSLGYGRYSLTMPVSHYFSSMQKPATVAGELNRNRLTLFDVDALQKPAINLFAAYGGENSWVVDREYARELLENLEEGVYYKAYLSFEEDITFPQYKAFEEQIGFSSWFGVRTSEGKYFENGHIGLCSTFSGSCITGWDAQKYPWLLLCGDDPDSDFQDILSAEQDESVMTTHLLSQLSYLADPQQKTFLSFFGETSDTFANAYDYVKEHGISIYGCVFYGEKEQLLRLSEMENVYGIYAQR